MMLDQSEENRLQALKRPFTELSAVFSFKQEEIEPMLSKVTLLENSLIIEPQMAPGQKCKIEFDFETIFSILRQNTFEDQKSWHKGRAVGIKFEKYQESIELHSPESETIELWGSQLGQKLNQRNFHELFKPIKKIGKGNFASVYLVVKHTDKQNYAIKAFSKEVEYAEERGKQSLENQITIMRSFDHPSLMKLEGVYETENSLYLCVQYLQGGILYDKIKKRHKFTAEELKCVMRSILEGVAVMHEKRIMHRDLKPENIMLRDEQGWECVIGDFGLATHADVKDYIYTRCGTPGYVAPQISSLKNSEAKYDPVCDIFSVGVIFHILATGKSPFPGKQADEVLQQNRECNINFESSLYKKLHPAWLNLLIRMLQKNPQHRITAKQALKHSFFDQENPSIPEELSMSTKSYEECESPLMITKNTKRKRNLRLRDDSCLKFKMKDNLLDDDNNENVDRINSPLLHKRIQRRRNDKKCKTLQPSNFIEEQ